MKSLDRDIRSALEEQIDNFLARPKKWENILRATLAKQGIEANLETVLAIAIGFVIGRGVQQIADKMGRLWTKEEAEAFGDILQRRASELRYRFLSTRIEEE